MAVTRTGSVGEFHEDSLGAESDTVTVPSDATLMVVMACGYSENDMFDLGVADDGEITNVTLNSDTFINIEEIGDDQAESPYWYGASSQFYLVNPSTGSQTLAWDWIGNGNAGEGVHIQYAFYKGVDTADPVRDRDNAAGYGNQTTDTLDAEDGDMIVAGCYHWTDGGGGDVSWTNATEALDNEYNDCGGAVGENDDGADTTITCSDCDLHNITVAVYKASAAAEGTIVPLTTAYYERIRRVSGD